MNTDLNLAMAYKNHHDWDKAKESYYKAIELNPKSHEAYFNLAYLCFNETTSRCSKMLPKSS